METIPLPVVDELTQLNVRAAGAIFYLRRLASCFPGSAARSAEEVHANAAWLNQDVAALRRIVAVWPAEPTSTTRKLRDAAGGPVECSGIIRASAHEVTRELACRVVRGFDGLNDAVTIKQELQRTRPDGEPVGRICLRVAVGAEDNPLIVQRQYDTLLARLALETDRVRLALDGNADGDSPPPKIIYHGRQCYSIGDAPPVNVDEPEHCVLQAFLELPAYNLSGLKQKSRVLRPDTTLKNLRSKYNGQFAPAIRLPAGKGRGGYSVSIAAAEQ